VLAYLPGDHDQAGGSLRVERGTLGGRADLTGDGRGKVMLIRSGTSGLSPAGTCLPVLGQSISGCLLPEGNQHLVSEAIHGVTSLPGHTWPGRLPDLDWA
jgi:hypothetical protein